MHTLRSKSWLHADAPPAAINSLLPYTQKHTTCICVCAHAVLVRVDRNVGCARCELCEVAGVELSAAPRRPPDFRRYTMTIFGGMDDLVKCWLQV
jgi:hypothetical protein